MSTAEWACIPVLERWRGANPWNSWASKYSKIGEVWVQRKTLHQKTKVERTSEMTQGVNALLPQLDPWGPQDRREPALMSCHLAFTAHYGTCVFTYNKQTQFFEFWKDSKVEI